MRRSVVLVILALFFGTGSLSSFAAPNARSLELVSAAGYLPGVPFLIVVDAVDGEGSPERHDWNLFASLTVDSPEVTLSTNLVFLRNGRGSVLVTVAGGGDFTLRAEVGDLKAQRRVLDRSGETQRRTGGTLPGSETIWEGIVVVTNDVTVPVGHTLTIASNSFVLFEGVAGGTSANDLVVRGSIRSQGTRAHPVVLTCAEPTLRWGQIRHTNAEPSVYQNTIITRAGRGRAEGHTSTTPVIRPYNSKLTFEHCYLTDFAEQGVGTPGKIGQASGSDLTFVDCLFQRARMGPEIAGTALACTNTWILDMTGPDDADGIYLHDQATGQQVTLSGCVLAAGGDDGIDTLGSIITVERCIVREWNSVVEDAKGISAFNGAAHIRDSLIVDCTVGISAKANASASVLVTVNNSTLHGNLTNVLAQYKSNAPGPEVDYRITNSILCGSAVAVQSDFAETNFTIRYSTLSQPWAGEGNVESDPRFADVAAHDFRLQPYSPAIDSGAPVSPADPDGSPADRGALTFVPPAPVLVARAVPEAAPFQFELLAYTNRSYVIEASADLAGWSVLKTVFQSAETNLVTDSSAVSADPRFFRARVSP
jgi:hypothetical protein